MTTATRYGLLTGVALSSYTLLEFALGFHTTSPEIGQVSGYFSLLLPFVFIITALWNHQNITRRPLPWRDGIDTGFRIALISGVLFTAFMALYLAKINPQWIDLMVEWQRRQMILNGATDGQVSTFMAANEKRLALPGMIVMTLVSTVTTGVMITLLAVPAVRLLFRSNRPQ